MRKIITTVSVIAIVVALAISAMAQTFPGICATHGHD